MGYSFSQQDIEEISNILGAKPRQFERSWQWHLNNRDTGQSLIFIIYNNILLDTEHEGSLISVQTQHGYFELHDCCGFIVFEPDEIIFVQSTAEKVSSLIIGKQCSCSMYSNIAREILHSDFNSLDPAVLLSAMQLSLTETVLA